MNVDIATNGQPPKRYFDVSEIFIANLRRMVEERGWDVAITEVPPPSTVPAWLWMS